MKLYPCKKCGGTVAVMKQKMSGFSYYRVNIDGSVEDNSDNCGSVLPVTGVIKEF